MDGKGKNKVAFEVQNICPLFIIFELLGFFGNTFFTLQPLFF